MTKRYLLASLLFLSIPALLHAQAPPAARGGSHLVAGGIFSVFSPDYGPNQLLGIGGFLDFNVGSHLSAEAEGRFLRFNQEYSVHEDNYLIGPRYRWHFRHWEPYAKFLLGNGQFNYPFSYGHGGYLVLAPGGGADFHLTRRFTIRAVDYEYQRWINFQSNSLNPNGFSTGIAYRIF